MFTLFYSSVYMGDISCRGWFTSLNTRHSTIFGGSLRLVIWGTRSMKLLFLLTELGENSDFPRPRKRTRTSETQDIVVTKYFWCTTSSSVYEIHISPKFISPKFISPNCIVKIIKSQLYIHINEIKQNYKQIYQRQRHIVELTTTQNIQEQNLIERCKHRHKTA